jgi:Fe(3+) dicitrate transport protein
MAWAAPLLYSGTRGGDWREHSDTRIDDLILKGNYQLDEANSFNAMAQYYEGRPICPAALSTAAYKADPYQSTRPNDKFWGRRTLVNVGYRYQEDRREFTVNSFFTKTLRSGYLDQGSFLSLSPREYWVRGVETRLAQGFDLGSSHEVGVGYRYINEAGHELRYRTPISANSNCPPPTAATTATPGEPPKPRVLYRRPDRYRQMDIHPGIRYEMIEQQQTNLLTHVKYKGDYNTAAACTERDVPRHRQLEPLRQHRRLLRQRAVQPDAQPGDWR